ncbi:MAG: lipid II flippase MurJ [Nitrospira sp.]
MEPLGFVLIPFLASLSPRDREKAAWPLLCAITVASLIIVAVFYALAPIVIPILAPGLTASAVELTATLARIQSIGVLGAGCGMVLSCFSQANGRFVWPALAVLLGTCAGWGLLVVGLERWGVWLAAWAQVAAVLATALLLLPVLGGTRGGTLSDLPPLLSALWSRMRPLVVSASYYRTGFVVDRFLASLLAPGSISMLDLVLRVHSAIGRVLNHGVVAPIVPQMARLAREQSWSSFNALWAQRARCMGWLSGGIVLALISGGVAAYHMGLIDPSARYGTLRVGDLARMWIIWVSCSGVVLTGGINHILNNAFYAQGDTMTPSKIEVLTYTVGLVMKGAGAFFGGLVGMALAISAYYVLNSLMLGMVLRKRVAAQRMDGTSVRQTGFLPGGAG